jgi:demethylmenaquinone methyltransferase/2-methoxy-6-polyprenyl-1,4-benzoquinol methylase
LYPESKIEIRGPLARFYDFILDIATLGYYARFIKKAIRWMDIRESDRILDLGSGTGRNACLMATYLKDGGEILGLDIGKEMIARFNKRCRLLQNVHVLKKRIDRPFDLPKSFDKVLLCFVLHGFPFEVQKTILDNCFSALSTAGTLLIVDYNEFSLDTLPWYLRIPFRITECPYAFEFISRDLKGVLSEHGFSIGNEACFFSGMVRCLEAVKSPPYPEPRAL